MSDPARPLLQLCVFGFGLFQNGDIGVGVFPEGEKIVVGNGDHCGPATTQLGD
jgi:hypothetical protein